MRYWLQPSNHLRQSDVDRGLRLLLFDGVCSQAMGVLTGGAVLVAFAVMLGASNTVIGLLAAVGPLSQVLQLPAALLVERVGLRKMLVVISSLLSRLFWLVVAVIPWLVPAEHRVGVLLASLVLYFCIGTVSACAFNSWMRDLVPDEIRGRFFGKRLAVATAIGAGLTLIVGIGLGYGQSVLLEPMTLYGTLFACGAVSGLGGVFFLARIPEPRMAPAMPRRWATALAEPFREPNYRAVLIFLGSWNFAINLAAPFFTVYMLLRLEMSIGFVLALSVLSQTVNVAFYRVWGRLADQFSIKSVLGVSGSLFVFSIILWPFLTLPEKHLLTIPLLAAIHIMAGISTAGVTLCSANLALKAAPLGQATAYLASNALVNGIAAAVAPMIAGVAADLLSARELSLSLQWLSVGSAAPSWDLQAFSLRGLDFVFVIAFILGQYALHRLLAIREEGEVHESRVKQELYSEVRKVVRHVSNVAGLRDLTYFPYASLRSTSRKLAARTVSKKRPEEPPILRKAS